MKIVLLMVGKTTESYYTQAIDEYVGRLKHYISFESEVIPELKKTKNLQTELQKEREGELIKKALKQGDYIVLLDEKGKEFTSVGFSDYIAMKQQKVSKRLVFIIGGPYGFSEEMYGLANEKISLSKMTFSHQMIRILFVEQLYRAMTILSGEPYHHE